MVLPNILGKEFQCINKIISKLPSIGVGDDCAIIDGSVKKMLISTDSFVEDVHFSLKPFSLQDIGERCSEAAISDIAAMGASPLYMLSSISGRSTKEVEKISEGIKRSLKRHKLRIIGGDITKSSKIMINITVIGSSPRPVMRSGAKKGDLVFISSYTGLSGAGLYLIKKGLDGYPSIRKEHLSPRAKIKEGLKISSIASSMIDISDGLASELHHIAHASKCSIRIEHIPIHKELSKMSRKIKKDPLDFALYGGEDYQLLYTVPPKHVNKAIGFKIGVVTGQTKHPKVQIKRGEKISGLNPKKGFLHF